MSKKELAAQYHASGCNCAMAVGCAFCDKAGVSEDEIKALTRRYGGGAYKYCGALLGAVAAMNMASGQLNEDDPAARIPIGVAALPRPSRFALTFAESGCKTASCRALSGNRRRSIGLSACDSASASPEAFISSITAHHRQTAPPIAMHNSMAACAPSSAACCTCPTVPFRHPKITETTIIAVHIRPISMTILLVFPNTC